MGLLSFRPNFALGTANQACSFLLICVCFIHIQNVQSVAQNQAFYTYYTNVQNNAPGQSVIRPNQVELRNRENLQQRQQQQQSPPHQQQQQQREDPVISYPKDYYDDDQQSVQKPQPSPAMKFAWRMMQSMILPQQENSVMCPILPQTLLASLYDAADIGAKNELSSSLLASSKELGKLVRSQISATQQTGVNKLDQAMAMFLGTGTKLNTAILEKAQKDGVEFVPVNFLDRNAAATTANNWVSHKSLGTIREIIAPSALDASTRLLLASVIYFKGKWKHQFTKTEPGLFETSPSFAKSSNPAGVQVPMMYMFNKLRYGEIAQQNGNGIRWVELPYEGSEGLSMILMLPKVRHQLLRSVDQLNAEDITEIISGLKQMRSANKMHLHVPKFNLYSSLSLVPALKNIGLKSIFDRASALSGLADEPLAVRDVSQRTFIAIDEQGTTATSAAALSFVALSAAPPPPTINFTVNEPFLLMIVDKTNEYPLFVGKIVRPESN